MRPKSFKHYLLKTGIIALLILPLGLSAQLSVSSMFASNMVLQQNTQVNIWGWATAGDSISVTGSWDNKTVKTATNSGRKWMLKLSTPAAKTDGSSYTVTIKGKTTVVLRNVLIGEVWLLSGQSNMELPLEGWGAEIPVEGSAQAIAAASYPNIRLIIAGKKPSDIPLANIEKNWILSGWTACSPATVKQFSAVGYFFGKEIFSSLNIPVGLVLSSWGGSSCETWADVSSLNFVAAYKNKGPWIPAKTDDNQTPNVLYNGMIAPIVPFTFAGVLWYQGETNVGRAAQLTDLFPAMISGWRNAFQRNDLPFYFVQLCPWGGYGTSLPETWEAQAYAQLLKNTGMAGTLDLGDEVNIHPARKEQIGHRLALWALAKNYGKSDLVYSGPQYQSMQIEGNKIRISFNYSGSGLKAGNNAPTHFEIAGSNLAFLPAKTLIDGQTLLVWSDNIASPKHVRYAWKGTATASLYNNEGLPATPFRSNTPTHIQALEANFLISSELIVKGEASKLDWLTMGADEVSLNGEIISETGTQLLKPDSTTSYIFVAKSDKNMVTKNFTVKVSSEVRATYPNGNQNKIPGNINPTWFDQGGEGVAYHDLTASNQGIGIRSDQGVDTEFQLPTGSVSGISTGEWLEYTIDVLQEGFYNFEIMLATSGKLGKFHLEFDGTDKTGLVSVPASGNYSKFGAVKIPGISLKKGIQVMRVVFDNADYNLGTISVSQVTTALITQKEAVNEVKIYPTITFGFITVSGINKQVNFSIINHYGQILKKGNLSNNQNIDLKFLNPGNYLIRLDGSGWSKTEKIIKL